MFYGSLIVIATNSQTRASAPLSCSPAVVSFSISSIGQRPRAFLCPCVSVIHLNNNGVEFRVWAATFVAITLSGGMMDSWWSC